MGTDPLAESIDRLRKRIDILIALTVMRSDQPQDRIIKLLARFGMTYDEIQAVLGVSRKTIAKNLKT